MSYLLLALGGVAIGVAVTFGVIGWQAELASWKLRAAQAVRAQAAELLAGAEENARYANCLMTPTAEYRTVRPKQRRLLLRARSYLRERLESVAAASGPDWDESLRTLAAGPDFDEDLRPVAAGPPSPAELAAHLAKLPPDPLRKIRIRVLQ